MRLARELGLPVAAVEVMVVGGRKLLVVERFDREVAADGTVRRIHQEDLCQALGVSPSLKYEEDHGPPLRRIAEVVQATNDSIDALLRAVVLDLAVGNGDAHAKNFSLLHMPDGSLRLTPLYDLMSTMIYGDDRLAMYVDDVRRMDRVTGNRLQNEGERWGMSRVDSRVVIDDLLARLPDAAARARASTPDAPDSIARVIEDQITRLRTELT
jgi:serine/threonine-protein kinase HipA